MIIFEKHFQLKNDEAIDEASELLDELMTAEKLNRKQILRLKLSVEEVMLRWQKSDNSGVCKIILEKKFNNLHLEIVMDGIYCDPFDDKAFDISEEDVLFKKMMANLGVEFKFAYWRGSNYLTYTFEKKNKGQLRQISITIVSAILLGMLINSFLPQISQILQDNVLTPLIDCFLGLLSAIVGPFMFISVVCGFCNAGDLSNLGKISKTIFGRFSKTWVLAIVIVGLVMYPFIKFAYETEGEGLKQVSSIFKLILNIIPSNFVEAFLQGNVLQIVFFAVLIGFVLVLIRPHSGSVISLMEQCNNIFSQILKLVSVLMPVFIFINIFKLTLSNNVMIFRDVWLLILIFVLTNLILFVIQAIIILLKERVSPLIVYKKMIPTFFINITTASSTSSLSANFECCEKKFGIEERLTKVGIPLGIAIFKIGTATYLSSLAVYCANAYNVPITIPFFFIILFISTILSVATPSVAGGAVACYILLFNQLGIPLEALSLAITLDIVADLLATSFNITHLQLQVLHAAHDMKALDVKLLKK